MERKIDINVYVVVSPSSAAYYNYMIKNYIDLARYAERVKFIVVHLENVAHLLTHTDRMIHVVAASVASSSAYHAYALNAALNDIDYISSQISILADSDTVMLQRGWDVILEEILSKYDMTGIAYEDINGYSSGTGKLQTYKNLPAGAWLAMSTIHQVKWSELDMTQGSTTPILIDTDELSRIYNLPVGYSVFPGEAGWRIPQFIYEHKLTYLTLSHVKPTKTAKVIKTGQDYHEEFWLPDGTPIIAHQRGSRKHAFRSMPLSAPFYDACDAHINHLKHT